MAKVSVVVPTRNRANLVGRAVRSALNQTMADVEVIVVDDGSHDNTADVMAAIGDVRVKYFRHVAHRGVSAARNTALSHVASDIVAFLDDDDEWLPEKLAIQLELIARASNNVGLVSSAYYEIEHGTNRVMGVRTPGYRGWAFDHVIREGRFGHTSTMVARRRCLEKVGNFDETYHWGEDLDMWLRIAQEFEFDFTPTPLSRVHRQPGGLTDNYPAEIRGTEAHLEKYRTFFERHPQILYTRLHRLGICYCLADDTRRARQILYRAIRQQPLAGKSYLALGLSLTGSDGVRMGYAAKHAIAVAVQRLLVRMGYTRLNSSSVTFEALCLLALSVQDQLTIIEFS